MANEKPSLAAELRAMAREAVNDARGMVHETYFGRPEGASGMGTPMSPTSQMVTADLQGQDAPDQDAHLAQYQPEPDKQPEPQVELDRE